MTRLIFIRHGESEFNRTKRYTGQLDVSLTEKGVTQANITADYILKNYKIDEIYSSDLSRAIDSASPIARPLGIEIKTDPRLREIFAGEWQGLYFADVKKLYKKEYLLFKTDKIHNKTSGGEGMLDVMERTLAAATEIAEANDGKTVLISTHNGPLMTLEVPLINISLNDTYPLSNNSVTEVEYENGKFKLIKLGYDEHLGNLTTNFSHNTVN